MPAAPPLPRLASVSVVFPAYNDAGTIPSMILVAMQVLPQITADFEVLVVNDGSADYTAEMLAALAALYPQLRVITHEHNQGYGAALRSGFAAAAKEWIFYTDGDAQYDPHELVQLAAAANAAGPEIDWVNGYKIARSDPLHRLIVGRLYHHFVKRLFGLPLRDTDCDFRLFRRSLLARAPLTSTSGTLAVELVKRLHLAGARVAEVPVHHYHRAYGGSQFFNFPRLWRTAVQLAHLWWTLRGAKPAPGPMPPAGTLPPAGTS